MRFPSLFLPLLRLYVKREYESDFHSSEHYSSRSENKA